MAKGKILVTGASGQQGGATARALLAAGQKVRVMGRSAERLQPLKELGAEVFIGDLNDKRCSTKALEGCNRAFLITTFAEGSTQMEMLQAMHFIDAARKRDLSHLVYTSVAACDENTQIPHFESKWRIEQYLHAYKVPYTVLRPVWFMENFTAPWMEPLFQNFKLSLPVHPNTELDMVCIEDIGAFATQAFLRPSEFMGQTIPLASDRLTLPEAMAKMAKATGQSYRYEEMGEEAAAQMPVDLYKMFRWYDTVKEGVNLAETAEWGIPLHTFDHYLRDAHRVSV